MDSTRRNPFTLAANCGLLLVILLSNATHAQVVLFDNLDNFRFDDDWGTANGPDRIFAQQFVAGDTSSVDQVTVTLARPVAAATGSIAFELWRDNGSDRPLPVGDPGAKIADLGSILEVENTIPVGVPTEFTFDNLVLGMDPDSKYWVVANFSGVRNIGGNERSIGWMANYSEPPEGREYPADFDVTAGTMGAAHAHLYRDADPTFVDAAQAFGLDDVFFAMKVEAMENGELDAVDVDILSSAIRQSLTAAQYDINQDGAIDASDRVAWIQDVAKTTFGDANFDGEFNAADMTLVFMAREYDDKITLNSTWAEGDWNGDGDFDSADLALANTLIGDANLDGTVTFPDFLALSAGFGQSGGWAQGDFDGNGEVEFPDFLALSANFGASNASAAAVPEPTGICLAVFGIVGFIGCRKRR